MLANYKSALVVSNMAQCTSVFTENHVYACFSQAVALHAGGESLSALGTFQITLIEERLKVCFHR